MKSSVWTITLISLLSIMLLGCGSEPSYEPATIAETDSETTVLIQNETENTEVLQEFALNNCGGKSDVTRIEHRSTSIDVSVSTEVAASIGASVQIISAEVETAVGASLSKGDEQATSIQLNAPPNTHMVFQIAWIGISQTGVAQNVAGSEMPVAFQSFKPKDVRIMNQYDIGCDPTPTLTPIPTPSFTPMPTPTFTPMPTPTFTPMPTPTFTPMPTPTFTPMPTPQTNLQPPEDLSPQEPSNCRILESQGFFPVQVVGECAILSDYPGSAAIYDYNAIAVDDKLEEVRMVCPDSSIVITSTFEKFLPPGAILYHWRGRVLNISSGCHIDFTIRDEKGVNIGLLIKAQP